MDLGDFQTWPGSDDESPFGRPLTPTEWLPSSRLRTFLGDSGYAVRIVASAQLNAVPDLMAGTKHLHEELEAYGISLPPRLYVVGSRHRDGAAQAFVAARRVIGTDLAGALADPVVALEADRLAASLLRYYDAKYREGGRYLTDLKLEQFVHGVVDGDVTPRLWFVDLDAGWVEQAPGSGDPVEMARLQWWVAEVANIVTAAEQASHQWLVAARTGFERILGSPLFDDERGAPRRNEITSALEGGTSVDGARWLHEEFDRRG
jgi:hypothetical protein